jgi:hypothetical protein
MFIKNVLLLPGDPNPLAAYCVSNCLLEKPIISQIVKILSILDAT